MNWQAAITIPKFTPIEEAFKEYGSPEFKLGNKLIYYLGKGFFLSYSETKFIIDGQDRMEYGDPGQYASSLYFFLYKKEAERFFELTEKFDFEGENIGSPFLLTNQIGIGTTYDEVCKTIKTTTGVANFQEGETKSFDKKSGNFSFQNKWITWNNYTFYFFGNTDKTKMTAFQFIFEEKDLPKLS